MTSIQDNTQVELQFAVQGEAHESPVLVEELTIDELAVREEYAACICGNK